MKNPVAPSIEVRKATQSDYARARSLFAELGGKLPVPDGETGLGHWQTLLVHPGTTVFVAGTEGEVLAIAIIHVLPNMTNAARPYALIENVVVSAQCRGNGLGRAVMEAAMHHAWDQGCYKIMLMTGKVRKDGGARKFYEALGFSADEKFAMTVRTVPERG